MLSTDYTQGKYYVYKESGVKIARSARIGHGVVFGKGTVVEDDAEISHATVGRNCVIGKGVRIHESHIYNGSFISYLFIVLDVVLETGCSIVYSIVGEHSVIKSGSSIQRSGFFESIPYSI